MPPRRDLLFLPLFLEREVKGRMKSSSCQPAHIDCMGKPCSSLPSAAFFSSLGGLPSLGGGIRYGNRFQRGTNVDVRFAPSPLIWRLSSQRPRRPGALATRKSLAIRDISNPIPTTWSDLCRMQGPGRSSSPVPHGKVTVAAATPPTDFPPDLNKADFNSANALPLAAAPLPKKRSLFLSGNAGDSLPASLAKKSRLSATKTPAAFSPISMTSEKWMALLRRFFAALKDSYALGSLSPSATSNVPGPQGLPPIFAAAIFLPLYALGGMLVIYCAFRCRWFYGRAACFSLAVFHDVLITLEFFPSLLSLRDFS